MTQTTTFPCAHCGANLTFVPGTTSLKCPYCGSETPINVQQAPIEELDYQAYVAAMPTDDTTAETSLLKCASCGAETRMVNVKADECPFCGSPRVDHTSRRMITPRSLLPFTIKGDRSSQLFREWIGSLWFAPNGLKRYAAMDRQKLQGVYIPYWTYDTDAVSDYAGERGEHYWERERDSDGNSRDEERTRWYPAQGTVNDRFTDVLVLASRSLEQKYATLLEPWDLQHLVPYQEALLSGFRVESYQVDLPHGFEIAKGRMEPKIRETVRQDIGGDEQRIHSISTTYNATTFKHLLLPLWLCTYRYGDKPYRIMINARTGKVTGERPWSWIKITLLVLLILAIIVGVGILYYHSQNR